MPYFFSSKHAPFWAIFLILSIAASIFSIYYFPKAFPIVHLDIAMNRKQALEKAKELAHMYHWGPESFEQSAAFDTDEKVKNFIELEGGGKKKLANILEKKIVSIYYWHVRHFKEFDPHETRIYITPKGIPNGFEEYIPENIPGASLSAEQAQTQAQETAKKDWSIDFEKYTLVETAAETKPSGRIDHQFIYELKDEIIPKGPIRLSLGVSGNKLTKLVKSVRVPDAFTRRYQEMRSFNNALAQIAIILAYILYILLGCFISFFILMKEKSLLFKPAFFISFILALLTLLSEISTFPLHWFNYDTAFSKTTIYSSFIFSSLSKFSLIAFGFGALFSIAEGLTRKAFGRHPLFWRIWDISAASSLQILGRTISGYLIVPIDMSILIIFYYFCSHHLGFWSPSSMLIDPNILATYVPWIYAVSNSLNAGFMEECLFRAIPLACAVLLGKRFGRQNIWLIIAFIIQALIFGAAHANYPAQPFYARLLELIFPSLLLGYMYVFYGLLPAIISHAVFDLIWFSFPIFLSDASGLWVQQVCVVLAGLFPLGLTIWARIRSGSWHQLTQQYFNSSWKKIEITHKEIKQHTTHLLSSSLNWLTIFGIGTISCILWLFFTRFSHDSLPTSLSRNEIIEKNHIILEHTHVKVPHNFSQFVTYFAPSKNSHKFIWRNYPQFYTSLYGNYLSSPSWQTRFVTFSGDLIDRGQEFIISLDQNGNVVQEKHIFPEEWKGAHLTENEARKRAFEFIKKQIGIHSENLQEISAISNKLPQRTDWEFIFKDTSINLPALAHQEQGEARLKLIIAGDQLSEYEKYIFVPESWERAYRNEQQIISLLTSLSFIMLCVIFLVGLTVLAIQLLNGTFSFMYFMPLVLLFLGKSIFSYISYYETIIQIFKTSEPFKTQFFSIFSSMFLYSFMQALFYAGIITTTIRMFFSYQKIESFFKRSMLGLSIGISLSTLGSIMKYFMPLNNPIIPDVAAAGTYFPILSQSIVWVFSIFFIQFIILYLVMYCLEYLNNHGWHPIALCILSICFGNAYIGSYALDHIALWLIYGSLLGIAWYIIYKFFVRFDRSLIPFIASGNSLLFYWQQALYMLWPGILVSAFIASCTILFFSFIWSKILYRYRN